MGEWNIKLTTLTGYWMNCWPASSETWPDTVSCSHMTVQYFHSVHTEPTNGLNFIPCEWVDHVSMHGALLYQIWSQQIFYLDDVQMILTKLQHTVFCVWWRLCTSLPLARWYFECFNIWKSSSSSPFAVSRYDDDCLIFMVEWGFSRLTSPWPGTAIGSCQYSTTSCFF